MRGALTSQEIAKYVEHCLKPGKAPGRDMCPNELLKTMSDEEFLIVPTKEAAPTKRLIQDR